jgi:serine/threonine protein phosphatase PrpC
MRQYAQENRARLREHKRRYREANREKIKEANRKAIRDENGEITAKEREHQARNRMLRALALDAMAERPRPEVCDICGGPPDPKKGMHFDHCHQTGKFRGWLCRKCNLMLGNAEDDPSRLREGAAYIERYR